MRGQTKYGSPFGVGQLPRNSRAVAQIHRPLVLYPTEAGPTSLGFGTRKLLEAEAT